MRIFLCTLSFIVVSHTTAAVLSEQRISAILERLRRAHAVGELAVNTPTGIYPIKDITMENFRRIFNFQPEAGTHMDVDFTQKKVADGNHIDHKQLVVVKESSSKKVHDEKKEQLVKSSKEAADSTAELTAISTVLTNTSENTNSAEADDVTILTTGPVGEHNSSVEAKNESKEVELTNSSSVAPTPVDKQHEEVTNTANEASSTKPETPDRVILTTKPAEKSLKQVNENEIEGSAELLDDDREGSAAVEEFPMSTQDIPTLLTGQDTDKDIIAASVDEPTVLISKPDDNTEQVDLPNPTLPAINLPQFPGVPYVFLPVKSIHGAEVPGLSYLLVPKKYENTLPNVFLTVNKA